MGSAYTPGLTVSGDIVVRRTRRLPIKGEVLIKVGDKVDYSTVVAQALLPGILQTIKLTERLGVEPKDALALNRLAMGQKVEKGEIVAETKGLFGLFKSTVTSDFAGTVESILETSGNILVREASRPIQMDAYISGKVAEILPEEGAIIETRGAMVQGIFGVGGERSGTIRCAVDTSEAILDAEHVLDTDAGKILVGGSGLTYAAIERAVKVGAKGLIVGGIRDVDLIKFLGYDIGVAITGQEQIDLSILVTEGFGFLSMADRTFKLLKSLDGKFASINGATQIRAGVIRPELIVPLDLGATASHAEAKGLELKSGASIRVIREPYFGRLGTVTELPAQLVELESGTEVRVLRAKLANGEEVTVPRANVEIIAT